MNSATHERKQRSETTPAAQTASLLSDSDPYVAVRKRLADVAGELRKAAETTNGPREGLLALALRFEHHARAGDNQ
jgi:hypothetical protein